jgi:hypothetical protein
MDRLSKGEMTWRGFMVDEYDGRDRFGQLRASVSTDRDFFPSFKFFD